MYTIIKTRDTKYDTDSIWEALAAFDEIYRWHPLVNSSPGTKRENFAIGANRVCHFHDGTSVSERVVGFTPGRSVEIELADFTMPFKRADAQIALNPIMGGTQITMTIHFLPKYRPVGDLMALMMIKPMMSKMMGEVLEGLDQHLGTSQVAA